MRLEYRVVRTVNRTNSKVLVAKDTREEAVAFILDKLPPRPTDGSEGQLLGLNLIEYTIQEVWWNAP